MTFHAKDGWCFERQADGSVWVFQRAGGRADGEIVATVVVDPDSWASVVASMCAEGETADTFSWAGAFHQGKVQSFIAALASTRRDLEAHMDAAKVREAALAESRGENETLKNERLRMLALLWKIRMTAERASVDDPVFVLPNAVIHLAETAMGMDRQLAQELANRREAPHEST